MALTTPILENLKRGDILISKERDVYKVNSNTENVLLLVEVNQGNIIVIDENTDLSEWKQKYEQK